MKKDIDALLKQALTPSDHPGFWLNQRILNQAKETDRMGMKKVRKIPAAVLAAAIVLGAGSVSAYAAWKYLTPAEIAGNVKDKKLAAAFQGKDAVTVNESQSYGGYKATFFGIVSGKDLSDYAFTSNSELRRDRTYTVVAIERADGTPMPDTSDEAYGEQPFFVSPLIKGHDPNWYNVATMSGGYSEFVEDGISYRLTECDNVEIFADQGLYLCVCSGTFYDNQAYDYDEATGEITRNEEYEGINALFDLPIDVSKADPQAAADYEKLLADGGQEEPEDEEPVSPAEAQMQAALDEWIQKATADNIEEYAQRVESTVQVLTPDEEGKVTYEYEVEGRGKGSGTEDMEYLFKDGAKRAVGAYFYSEDALDSIVVTLFTKNEDGTVTFAAYIPK